MNGREVRTVKLSWDEVGTIISGMACEIVGVHVSCKAVPQEEGLWWIAFQNYRMPLPELCRLVQTLHPTVEDWEDALPDEGGTDVKDIGMYIAEKLMSNHLHLIWEHHIITEDGLWLVGVTEMDAVKPTPDGLAQAIAVIADHLHQQEDKL